MKILVISSNLIGDNILSSGVIRYFMNKNSKAKFTFIIGPSVNSLYQHFPNKEKIIIIKKQKYNLHWLKIFFHCWPQKWDIVVDFRSSLISYLLHTQKKLIFKKNNQNHHLDQLKNQFGFDCSHLQIYNDSKELEIVENQLNKENKYIVIFPGGNWKPKIWDVKNYNRLIKILNKNFMNLKFIIIGSSKENDLYYDKVVDDIPANLLINLMGTSLTLTYAYMKKSKLFIGNDSGLMHLSVASKLITIGLFGPTNDKIYGPRSKSGFVVRTKEDYDPNKSNYNQKKSYMDSITPEQIFDLIKNNNLI